MAASTAITLPGWWPPESTPAWWARRSSAPATPWPPCPSCASALDRRTCEGERMKRFLPLLAIAGLLLAGAGCKSSAPKDPILRLSAEESLAKGKELLVKKKYDQARPYFTHA